MPKRNLNNLAYLFEIGRLGDFIDTRQWMKWLVKYVNVLQV